MRQKGCGEDWCSQPGCKAADCVLRPRSVSGTGSLRCPVGWSAVRACDRQPSSTGRGALFPGDRAPGDPAVCQEQLRGSHYGGWRLEELTRAHARALLQGCCHHRGGGYHPGPQNLGVTQVL